MVRPSLIPLPRRALPPAGGFAPPVKISGTLSATLLARGSVTVFQQLENQLQYFLPAGEVVITGSGRAALVALFRALRKCRGVEEIVIGAFTCPDIASAAHCAGVKLVVRDISPQTLELQQPLPEARAPRAVLLSNLFGMVDDLDPYRDDEIIIDDASQSYLSFRKGVRCGARAGSAGILSFGRGKALSGVGGGAVILGTGNGRGTRDDHITGSQDVAKELQSALSDFERSSLTANARQGLFAVASSLLERPGLYWFPFGIPQLGLGESKYSPHVQLRHMSGMQAAVALTQLYRAEQLASFQRSMALRWHSELSSLPVVHPVTERAGAEFIGVVPTRYPVLVPSEARPRIAKALAALGVSRSYDRALVEYEGIDPVLGGDLECPAAREVARRLLTLPVHANVSERDIEEIVKVMRGELS